MDALSETLRVVRLAGAVFFNARFSEPWAYESMHADQALPVLAPGAERVIIFHMVTQGECVVELAGAPPLRLVAGDVVIFPHGDAHRMCSSSGVQPARRAALAALLARPPRTVFFGGGGAVTRLICGYLACDARLAKMLLSGLPPVVRVNVRETTAGPWLEASMRYALAEARSPRPGGAGILSKLAEVLFIEVLRSYMTEADGDSTGWLAAVQDRVVGAALGAVHRDAARCWTLEDLAREAGASRSVLADRFQRLVGTSPMQYLTQWRMIMAANLLRGSAGQLLDVAQAVGYQTDTAFIRAFRREYGVSPAAWRRAQRTLAAAAA